MAHEETREDWESPSFLREVDRLVAAHVHGDMRQGGGIGSSNAVGGMLGASKVVEEEFVSAQELDCIDTAMSDTTRCCVCVVIHTLMKNGIIESANKNEPIVETVFMKVKPSPGR